MGSLNRFNLAELCFQNSITALVETGTYLGAGIELAMKSNIERIHSIEIDPDYYFRAVERYRENNQVSIHLGSSSSVLPSLLEYANLNYNCFFWLDAHFPMADKGSVAYDHETDKEKRMPLIHELTSIVSRRYDYKDIIIIDDLRCFTDDSRIKADSFDAHMSKLGHRGFNCTRQSVVGVTLNDILVITADSYSPQFIYEDEGYIILLRKELK